MFCPFSLEYQSERTHDTLSYLDLVSRIVSNMLSIKHLNNKI
jgi:hypothetical protein